MKYIFDGSYTASKKMEFEKAQEEDLVKLCEYLKTPQPKITYKVFDSREKKQASDPHHSISRASARFDEMTTYQFWLPDEDPHLPHELTHLVAHTWAKPYIFVTTLEDADGNEFASEIEMVSTSFIQEGLAVAVDDIVFTRPIIENSQAKSLSSWIKDNSDEWPGLAKIINFDDFCEFDNRVGISFAAAICRFLLKNFGIEKFKKFYASISENNSPRENVVVLEKIYKMASDEIVHQAKSI